MPDITPGTPQKSDPSKVWISREEYERLQAMEVSQNANRIFVAPDMPYVSSDPDHTVSDKMAKQQKIIGLVLAFCLLIPLTVNSLAWLTFVAVPIFVLFALMSVVDYHKQRRREEASNVNELVSRSAPSVWRRLLILVGIVLLIPVIGYALMIAFIIMMFSVGGGAQGS